MHHLERLLEARVVGLDAFRRGEVRLRLFDVTDFEIEERESLERAGVVRRDADRHVPLVECALVVVFVRQDPRIQIVRIRQVRVALETVHRDTQRGLELPLTPERFAEPQEDEALWILRELRRETADVVSHARTPGRLAAPAPPWQRARPVRRPRWVVPVSPSRDRRARSRRRFRDRTASWRLRNPIARARWPVPGPTDRRR